MISKEKFYTCIKSLENLRESEDKLPEWFQIYEWTPYQELICQFSDLLAYTVESPIDSNGSLIDQYLYENKFDSIDELWNKLILLNSDIEDSRDFIEARELSENDIFEYNNTKYKVMETEYNDSDFMNWNIHILAENLETDELEQLELDRFLLLTRGE